MRDVFYSFYFETGARGGDMLVVLYRISYIRLICKGLMLLVVFVFVTDLSGAGLPGG